MQKELQALRCGDSRSGSYTTFTDGGGLAAQHLVTTQASPKSCLSREMEEGLHIKTKTYFFALSSQEKNTINKEEGHELWLGVVKNRCILSCCVSRTGM